MSEASPLPEHQQRFIDALPSGSLAHETVAVADACGRILPQDLTAPEDSPPYHRAIVEGFVVHTAETANASEETPATFKVVGQVAPGDTAFPELAPGTCVEVVTGSIVADGPLSAVRMFECNREGDTVSVTRPFPPRFFLEDRGCDVAKGSVAVAAGTRLSPLDLGTIASLGLDRIGVSARPRVALFSSGDEVVPHTDSPAPGAIRDSNRLMLSAAITEAGGLPTFAGIMGDDFNRFCDALRATLSAADMVVISGGTAVGGRDFIADLIRAVGTLVVDGVPMRSGRPLIMGHMDGRPIVAVAGHPPEALRGFELFGAAAIDRISGGNAPLPEDNVPAGGPGGGGPGGPGGPGGGPR